MCSLIKEKIMFETLKTYLNRKHVEEGLLRHAEVEYNKEYRWLVKSLGRQPTLGEVKNIFFS